jgi:glucan 1,3-beta-glucosidase
MRGPAEPSRLNQARYIREFVTLATREHLEYNLVEAFDQPWKRRLEGTVGGYWGIYTTDRQAKFPFAAPVREYPDWMLLFGLSTVGMLLLRIVSLAGLPRHSRMDGWSAPWYSAGVAAVTSTVLVLGGAWMATTLRTPAEWLVGIGGWGGSAVLAVWLVRWTVQQRVDIRPLLSIATLICWARAGRGDQRTGLGHIVTSAVYALLLFGAAAITLQLVFDPRYRDFPTLLLLIPAMVTPILSLVPQPDANREERWLSGILALGAGILFLTEDGVTNHQAMAWIATILGLALPTLFSSRHPSPPM